MQLDSLCPVLISPGDVALDVGANVGQSARVLSPLVGPAGRCICFEPEPRAFLSLSAMAAGSQFSNVEPYCCALSDHIGHDLLFWGDDPGVAQASTIIGDLANIERLGRHIAAVKIETDTVDNFCATRSIKPSFIKIDVEGAEDRVFSGAQLVLTEYRPLVVFEFGYGFDDGRMPSHFTTLQRLEYQFFIVDIMFKEGRRATLPGSTGYLIEISPDQIAEHRLGGNLLAIPSSEVHRIDGIPKVSFDSVRSSLTLDVPTVRARVGSVLRNAEHRVLGVVEKTYRAGRSHSVSGLRRLARYLRS